MLCFCKYTLELRVELYNNILTLYGMRIFVKLINMQPRMRTITVLMCFRNILNKDVKTLVFQRMCFRLLSNIAYCFSNSHTIERCLSRQWIYASLYIRQFLIERHSLSTVEEIVGSLTGRITVKMGLVRGLTVFRCIQNVNSVIMHNCICLYLYRCFRVHIL